MGETAYKETDKHVRLLSLLILLQMISEIPVQNVQIVHEKWHTPEIGSTSNQPRNIFFPAKMFGKKMRSFYASWFDRWSWLHYEETKDFPCIRSFQKNTLSCHIQEEKVFISNGF
jgi:hypothetical protein